MRVENSCAALLRVRISLGYRSNGLAKPAKLWRPHVVCKALGRTPRERAENSEGYLLALLKVVNSNKYVMIISKPC